MKIKLEIDLEDFWTGEEDGNIGDQLREHICYKVKEEVWKLMQKKVEEHCQTAIKKEIEVNMYKQMNLQISEFIKTGQVKSTRDSSKLISIEAFICEKFQYDSGWSSPNETIKKLAQQFALELKARYDINFATQIVVKLSEQKLLKEEVAHLLLPQEKP